MITEKKLQYFYRSLQNRKHFTAPEIYLSLQPALSKTIQELEEELHYPLFDRQGKHHHFK